MSQIITKIVIIAILILLSGFFSATETAFFSMNKIRVKSLANDGNRRAKKAMKLKTGARGLRTIMEDVMLDIMFVTPDDRTIEKVVVEEDTIKTKNPTLIHKKIEKESNDKIENKTEDKTA